MTLPPFATRRLESGHCYACAGDDWVVNVATVTCATCHPPASRATDAQVALVRQFAQDSGYPAVYLGGWIKVTVSGERDWQFWTARMSRVGATWLLERLAKGAP